MPFLDRDIKNAKSFGLQNQMVKDVWEKCRNFQSVVNKRQRNKLISRISQTPKTLANSDSTNLDICNHWDHAGEKKDFSFAAIYEDNVDVWENNINNLEEA